jgi:hypothetical protein
MRHDAAAAAGAVVDSNGTEAAGTSIEERIRLRQQQKQERE